MCVFFCFLKEFLGSFVRLFVCFSGRLVFVDLFKSCGDFVRICCGLRGGSLCSRLPRSPILLSLFFLGLNGLKQPKRLQRFLNLCVS